MQGRVVRRVKGPRTNGARDLDAYLREKKISVPTFCELHGLDRICVQRLISGVTTVVSVELAVDIEKATDGVVAAESWHPKSRMADTSAQAARRRNAGTA